MWMTFVIPILTPSTLYTSFAQGLRPLCLSCAPTKPTMSPLKAQRRWKGCLTRSVVTQVTFGPRNGRHGRCEVLSMLKTVAQRSPRRSIAHRSLMGGRRKAPASPLSQNGCRGVGHRSTLKKNAYCGKFYVWIWAILLPPLCHHCAPFGRPIASIERSLWWPLCLHSATTATLEPPWRWFCFHSVSFARPLVQLQQFWWLKERTRVVL